MGKKQAVFTIIACSIAAILLSLVLVVGLSSDGFGFLAEGKGRDRQPFGDERLVEFDPAEDPVDSLEVNWENGPVVIKVVPGGVVRVEESSRGALEEKDQMQVTLSDGKLQVDWDHTRFKLFSFSIFGFGSNEKALTIELPQEVAGQLAEVECSNISGDMEVGAITCEEGEFSSVSGAISLAGTSFSGECGLSTTSGDIALAKVGAEKVNASTTSGALYFEDTSLEEGDFNSTSGEIYFQGGAKRFHASTISGASHASFSGCPEDVGIESVSGQITVELPRSASFRVEHDTVSGEFVCDFPTPGGSEGTYGKGTPQGELDFSTTSGDMQVLMR